ncbi:MAG: recombination mediator RecR [Thermodesulfobacteriota bacterium]
MIGPLESLIQILRKLPGVGEKTATRYAFHILNADPEEIQALVKAIMEVKQKLRLCSQCYNLTDTDPCRICSDPKRDASTICVVEAPLDLIAVEKSGLFRGRYHVLHGALSPLDAILPEDIRLGELVLRVAEQDIREIILALNPTVEGEATAAYIHERLQDTGVTISRIAYGIPVGSSLEYTDPLTLSKALENRKRL